MNTQKCSKCGHFKRCSYIFHPDADSIICTSSEFSYLNPEEYAQEEALTQPEPIRYYRDIRGGEEEHF
jgi:hypothetical protein